MSPAANSVVGRQTSPLANPSQRFHFCARFTRGSGRPSHGTTRRGAVRGYHLPVVHTSHAMYAPTSSEQPAEPRGGALTFLPANGAADAWKNRVRASLPAPRTSEHVVANIRDSRAEDNRIRASIVVVTRDETAPITGAAKSRPLRCYARSVFRRILVDRHR